MRRTLLAMLVLAALPLGVANAQYPNQNRARRGNGNMLAQERAMLMRQRAVIMKQQAHIRRLQARKNMLQQTSVRP